MTDLRGLAFILPLPPSVNEIYKIHPLKKKLYLTHAGEDYKDFVGKWVGRWMEDNSVKPLNAPSIVMEVRIAWGSTREQDPANLDKLLPDTLQGIAWVGSDANLYVHHIPPAIVDLDVPRVFIKLTENNDPPQELPAMEDDLIIWQRQQQQEHLEALDRRKKTRATKRKKAAEKKTKEAVESVQSIEGDSHA